MIGHRLSVLLAALALAGCATAPTSPSVMVLPAPGKPLDEFRAEDLVCRQWAQQQGDTQRRFDVAYQQCMYAKGNQIPGRPSGRSAPPPASSSGPSAAPGPPPVPPAPAGPAAPAPGAAPPPSGG